MGLRIVFFIVFLIVLAILYAGWYFYSELRESKSRVDSAWDDFALTVESVVDAIRLESNRIETAGKAGYLERVEQLDNIIRDYRKSLHLRNVKRVEYAENRLVDVLSDCNDTVSIEFLTSKYFKVEKYMLNRQVYNNWAQRFNEQVTGFPHLVLAALFDFSKYDIFHNIFYSVANNNNSDDGDAQEVI